MNREKELKISQALAVCAELTGTQLSDAAFSIMLDELMAYPEETILAALRRCYRELTGRLSLAAIMSRLDTGLPSADEVFGLLVEGWRNEELTVVVPEIAQIAAGQGASQLFFNHDKTGARMAFRESYERLAAQCIGQPVRWQVSAGTDKNHLERAVMEALRQGKLSKAEAIGYLPSGDSQYQLGVNIQAALPCEMLSDEERLANRAKLAVVLGSIRSTQRLGEDGIYA